MKIILNVDAITYPLTGIGNYVQQLASGLENHPRIEDVRFFSSHKWINSTQDIASANSNLASLRKHLPFKHSALKLYNFQKNFWFRNKSKSLANDYIFHSPNFLLMPYQGKSVVTIHDLSFIRYPQTHPPERIRLLEKELPKSLKRANKVIAISKHVKQEILNHFNIPADKIAVVSQGVDKLFYPRNQTESEPALKKYGLLHSKYLLTVATLEPRKNLNSLLDAYSMLPEALRQKHRLVIVGDKGWLNNKLLKRLTLLEARGDVIVTGYVSADELPVLYSAAYAFALPSLYEGFGLPVIEAMASGTPVLTTNSSSLPEVAGDAAILTDAHDITSISNGLIQLLTDKHWRQISTEKGIQRANQFSWKKCIDTTIKLYQALLPNN